MADKVEFAEARPHTLEVVNPPTSVGHGTARSILPSTTDAVVEKPVAQDISAQVASYEAYGTGEGLDQPPGGIVVANENFTNDQWLKLKRQKQTATATGLGQYVGFVAADEGAAGLETPGLTLSRLANELNDLQKSMHEFMDDRRAALALQYGQTKSDMIAEELTADMEELFSLNGTSIMKEMENLKKELDTISQDEGCRRVLDLFEDRQLQKQFDETSSTALLQYFKKLKEDTVAATSPSKSQSPGTTPRDPGSARVKSVEVYVPKTQSLRNYSGVDMLIEYNKLDDRVQKLESAFGIDKFSSTAFPFADISSAIQQITERVMLLDPKHVESLSRRVADLNKDIDKLITLKSRQGLTGSALAGTGAGVSVGGGSASGHRGTTGGSNAGVGSTSNLLNIYAQTTDFKIDAIYNQMETWKHVVHLIPKVVTKLKYMAMVAHNASGFSKRLSDLETSFDNMNSVLNSVESAMKSLEQTMAAQSDMMEKLLLKL